MTIEETPHLDNNRTYNLEQTFTLSEMYNIQVNQNHKSP